MATFHAEPNRASPPTHIWFSVETPNVFAEHKLPACETNWSRAHRRKFQQLEKLAEAHGTYIRRSSYGRG
jgi:hypothetical protein